MTSASELDGPSSVNDDARDGCVRHARSYSKERADPRHEEIRSRKRQ
jgi:hypothetical protein